MRPIAVEDHHPILTFRSTGMESDADSAKRQVVSFEAFRPGDWNNFGHSLILPSDLKKSKKGILFPTVPCRKLVCPNGVSGLDTSSERDTKNWQEIRGRQKGTSRWQRA